MIGKDMVYEFKDGKLYISNKEIYLLKYKFIKILGNGASGVVLKGIDTLTDREVAIKIWLPRKNCKYPDKTRFLEEVKKVSKLNSSRIVQLYDANYIDENYFYAVFELVDGKTLKDWLSEGKSIDDRYKIVCLICEEMELVHDKKIYHGDLHTKNIMITGNDDIKLLDFNTSIFERRKQGDPHKREGKLILETGLKLLPEENEYKFLNKKILECPPICVPKALLSLAQMIWKAETCISELDDYGKKLFVFSFGEYVTKVPFFNLNSIVKYFVRCNYENKYIYLLLGYISYGCKEKLKRQYNSKIEPLKLNENNMSELIRLYNEWRIEFIKRIEKVNLPYSDL